MIGIIDYGSGNVRAIVNVFKRAGVPHHVIRLAQDFDSVSGILLPGVGAFDDTMERLNTSGLKDGILRAIQHGLPLLGICVGMQVLASGSEEGTLPGLSIVPGHVRKVDISRLTKLPYLPHMGWNAVKVSLRDPLFRGVDEKRGFYFLHSYCFVPSDPLDEVGTTSYGATFTCAVRRGNVYGVQFHPEKSHGNGVRILTNFAEMCTGIKLIRESSSALEKISG